MSSTRVSGDPLGESDLLVALQKQLADKPGVLATARGMSHFGEHALGWMGTAALGYGLATIQKKPADGPERRGWLTMGSAPLSPMRQAWCSSASSAVHARMIRGLRSASEHPRS